MLNRVTVLVLGSVLVASSAMGATQGILGKKLLVKDSAGPTTRKIVVLGKELASPNTVEGDPVANGATLRVLAYGATDSDETFNLPSTGWSAIGTIGFKYLNTIPGGAVKKVIIKKSPSGTFLLKVLVKGSYGPVATVPPNPGTDGGIFFTINGGGDTYCVAFGAGAGGTITNTTKLFKVIAPTAESCPGADQCPPTVARAKAISTPADRIDGPLSRGTNGDILLANDKIQVVIQKPGRVMFGIGPYGGNIIDADLQRCDVGERDNFEEVGLLLNLENTANYTSVTVLDDGSLGGPARIRATGPDDLLDYINASSTVAGFGFTFPPAADDTDLDIDIQTDYILDYGADYVRVETTVTNLGAMGFTPFFGDIIGGSGQIEPFLGAYGFGEPLVTTACAGSTFAACTSGTCDQCNMIAYSGEDDAYGVSYGYIHGINGSTSFNTDGVSVHLLGQSVVLVLIGAQGPNAMFALAPSGSAGDSFTITRYFAVADGSVGGIADIRNVIRGVTTGTLTGTVTSGGLPVENADVAVQRATFAGGPSKNVVDHFRTDANGQYTGTLPPGSYTVRANKDGRAAFGAPDNAPVVITAALTTVQDFTLPDQGTLVVNVTDENGASIPAKVQVVGFDPTPDPLNTQTVLGTINNLTGVFGAETSNVDGLVYGIAAVFFADKTGTTGSVPLEPGSYQLAVSRGPRYSANLQPLTITAGLTTTVNVQIAKAFDTPGFVGSDFHVHSINSPDSEVTDAERVATMLAEGVEFFTPSDHEFRTDFTPTIAAMGVGNLVAVAPSAEITTFDYGHFNSWPVTINPAALNGGGIDFGRTGILPGQDFPGAPFFSFNLTPAEIYTDAHLDPRPNIIQINHMHSHFSADGLEIDTADTPPQSNTPGSVRRLDPSVTNYFDAGFDALEVWIGTNGRNGVVQDFLGENLGDWFNMLNQGILRAGMASSDTHQRRTTQMNARSFVASATTDPLVLATDPAADALAANVLAGKAIGSNGPFVTVSASAASTGDTAGLGLSDSTLLTTTDGAVDVTLTIKSPRWAEFDRVQFFVNAAPQPYDHDADAGTIDRYRAIPSGGCLPASGCYQKDAPGDFTITPVDVAAGVPGDERLDATVTLNLTGLVGDVWIVALVRGTDGVSKPLFPILPNSIKQSTNLNLADLTDGNLGEDGMMALAFTNPIYVDVGADGWTPPGVTLTPP